MRTKQVTEYICETCGHSFGTEAAAQACEKRSVTHDKGVKVGDIIVITQGEGAGEKAKVTDRFIFGSDWGPSRYSHTVGLNAALVNSWGSRQLTFDSYKLQDDTRD